MKSITVTAPHEGDGRLTPTEWCDLRWVLTVLDDWLLCAEPRTVQELGRSLRSAGKHTTPEAVLGRIAQLRSIVTRAPK